MSTQSLSCVQKCCTHSCFCKESSANSSQEILGNGDTEIFSTLISLTEDLELLKTCRLVCKSWNEFASRALRKLPWVFFSIHKHHGENTEDRIKLLEQNKEFGLPSPFRNFKVYAHFTMEPSLMFLKYVGEHDNNYSIDLRIKYDKDPAELQTVLSSNLHNSKITKLKLNGVGVEDGPCVDIFQPDKIRLQHLTTLTIKQDTLASDSMVILCETLCQYSPLKSFNICNNHSGESLKKLMSPGGMKHLENLELTIEDEEPISYEDWKYICSRIMEIPCLKQLGMAFPRYYSENYESWYMDGFEAIIKHFAGSLETLRGAPLPPIQNNCFPKLRELHDGCLSNEYQFSYSEERYPLLKKATFFFGDKLDDNVLHFPCVNEGIHFYFGGLVRFESSGQVMKLFGQERAVVRKDRPFRMDETLLAIFKSVPKVTSLELQMYFKNKEGSGGCVEGPFNDLEKLSLGPNVLSTRHLFKNILPTYPKLQYLIFYLSVFVSAEDVLEGIGHLTRITVVILENSLKLHEEWVEEMERLRKMLPAVVEIKYPVNQGKSCDDHDVD